MDSTGYFWIIGGGLMQEPLIDEVKSLNLKTIVTDLDESCVCSGKADLFYRLDVFDVSAHVTLADHLTDQGVKIRGVLAAGIDAPETMAVLAAHLGLPGVDPEIARLVHHKGSFRRKIEELGYPVPKYKIFGLKELDRLEEFGDLIGYPLIIKNTDSSGSRGTRIFRTPDFNAMRETAETAIAVSRSGLALIESCWEGTEHTLESLFDYKGEFHPCFITDRHFDKAGGFALETGLRHPSVLDQQTQAQMFALAYRVATDLGIRIGAAKFDFMVTNEGPRIIEMTVRLSGGFDCQYLVPAATGKAVLRAAILTALGEPISNDLIEDRLGKVGVTGSVWPKPGRIVRIEGVAEAETLPGVEKVILRQGVGDEVQPYYDCTRRVCFIIAVGDDEAQAMRSLRDAQDSIKITTVAEV